MQDIVPKKSIREITKPSIPRNVETSIKSSFDSADIVRTKTPHTTSQQVPQYAHTKNIPPRIGDRVSRKKSTSKFFLLFFLLVTASAGVFLHTQREVKVFVSPETVNLSLADKDIRIPTENIATITASTSTRISVTTKTSTTTPAKAQGEVIIYNANSTSQTLVSGTRLQTANGLIFRTTERVVVPRSTVVNRQEVPGSITVRVVADEGGTKFNIDESDFTLPGLAGSPRFETVYARSRSKMTGGNTGVLTVVDEVAKNNAIATFKTSVQEYVTQEVLAKREGITVGEPKITHTFTSLSSTEGEVEIIAELKTVDEGVLASALSDRPQTPTTTISIISDLSNSGLEIKNENQTTTTLTGTGAVTIEIMPTKEYITSLLSGRPFSEFRNQVTNIKDIQSIRFTSRPFWLQTFPSPEKITIIKTNE